MIYSRSHQPPAVDTLCGNSLSEEDAVREIGGLTVKTHVLRRDTFQSEEITQKEKQRRELSVQRA